MRQGLTHVYTGNGKGKTTAALGLALRACGHGWRVLVIQFMKGDPSCGEVQACADLRGITLVQSGLSTFAKKGEPSAEDLRLAREGLARAREAMASGKWDLIILDEINVAIDYGLVALSDALDLMGAKPEGLELVLTGRSAAPELVDAADLVTEMSEIKHPHQLGMTCREGIDF